MTAEPHYRAHFMSGDGSSDSLLDLEFAYTSYWDSCRDLYSPYYFCRRPIGHEGVHAAGFGSGRLRWQHEPNHPPHMLS